MKARLIVMLDYDTDDSNLDEDNFREDLDFLFDHLATNSDEPVIAVIPLEA